MDYFNVYVPADDSPLRAVIDPRSAIVADSSHDAAGDRIEIYYEGNRYGAPGLESFAERCRQAAGRLAERAPTVARSLADRDALTLVGTYTDRFGVTVHDEAALEALARWLGRWDAQEGADPQLVRELRLSDAPR